MMAFRGLPATTALFARPLVALSRWRSTPPLGLALFQIDLIPLEMPSFFLSLRLALLFSYAR